MNLQKFISKIGLSLPVVILLAALALPRAIAHDLGWASETDAVNKLLVYIPLIIWIAVTLWKKVPKPILTLCTVGLFFGIMLALTHQITWATFWEGGQPPQLGGNLEGQFSAGTEEIILRIVTFISSILTGVVMGAAAGLIAFGVKFIFPVTGKNSK